MPRTAWLCAIVAILNAASWSIVTPPFEVPDEPNHFAYTKQLAETGSLPRSSKGAYATNVEIVTVLNELRYPQVRQQPRHRTISTAAQQKGLERKLELLRTAPIAKGSFAAGTAASQPPLYYALEAVPYGLGGNMLVRLQLMRLLSALMAGVTALFVFLFVREALPGAPWAWRVGGLAAAVVPLLGFVSGAVNPDSMLFAVCAVLFYALARAFKRGLTLRLAAMIGVVIAVGSLTKLNFIGLIPGAVVGLVVLTFRARREIGASSWLRLVVALAISAAPVALYGLVNIVSNHHVFGVVSSALNTEHLSLGELSYIWQLFLPRLPGMHDDFPGMWTTRTLWFDGYVGLYGWLDTQFPVWVYNVAIVPLVAIGVLLARGLVMVSGALKSRLGEVIVYALMACGLLTLVGSASYKTFPHVSASFAEPRYLLPLLPLLAAVVVLAARGAGRRLGPAVGALTVVLFLAHDIFSQLLVVTRYYS